MFKTTAMVCAFVFASAASVAQPANSNSAPGFNLPIPNIPGKSITALVVNYPPGGGTPSHHHAPSAFITGYVLEGAVRSQVDGGWSRSIMSANISRRTRAPIIKSARMPARPSRPNCWRSSWSTPMKRR